ncbi:MAG: erythromycin esterase family protein [Herminiimonas sp.]|nr:erythromycin esterase family protein [Herminiimonas sp.]
MSDISTTSLPVNPTLSSADQASVEALRRYAIPLQTDDPLDAVLNLVGDASIVLLGEASHGTREFYAMRAQISKRLVSERGFDAIAVEADWPAALRVSRFVQDARPFSSTEQADRTVEQALAGFERFPQWMWRNTEVVAFLEWLREHNGVIAEREQRVGFFGLDLYSLRESMDAVVHYLEKTDPEAAKRARERYACFDHMAEDPQAYGYATTFGGNKGCEAAVVQQLVELTAAAARRNPVKGQPELVDESFYAHQNARVARNAETYYRSMFQGRDESWNVRDTHMAETLSALREHGGRHKGRAAKLIVWAHNSHLGDARATEMGEQGQLNLGELVRQGFPVEDTFLLGFSTHAGSVTAASDWDAPAELKQVKPSLPGSFERLFHDMGLPRFLLPIRGQKTVTTALNGRRLERAIGVIYQPESERLSHYFHADLARQFDAVIHVDQTTALPPLERTPSWHDVAPPETWPSGL